MAIPVTEVDLANSTLSNYGTQGSDVKMFSVEAPNRFEIKGNSWKAVDLEFTVTEDSYLQFSYQTLMEGEIQGIGLDTDNDEGTGPRIIQLDGTQAYGQTDVPYTSNGAMQDFTIKLADYYAVGTTYTQLVFANDDDYSKKAHSVFNDIKFLEFTPSPTNPIVFDAADATSYTANQDQNGSISTSADGSQVTLTGNAWKKFDLSYTVTENTVIEFDFKSTAVGEIQGFSLETDNNFTTGPQAVKLQGIQDDINFNDEIATYTGNGEFQSFIIDASDIITGDITSLAFINDSDFSGPNPNSIYENFRIYDLPADGGPVVNAAELFDVA